MARYAGKSSEQIEREWWEKWWEQDFSWGSLGTSSEEDWNAIQQFWRRDPEDYFRIREDNELLDSGELIIDPQGQYWHLAHVPLNWQDGTPTWKHNPDADEWERLYGLLDAYEAWLSVGLAPHIDGPNSSGSEDITLYLKGVVLNRLFKQDMYHNYKNRKPHIQAQYSYWLNPLWAGGSLGSIDFSYARLKSDVYMNCEVEGDATFRFTQFCGTVEFHDVSANHISFNCGLFEGIVLFGYAKMKKSFRLQRAVFRNESEFGAIESLESFDLLESRFCGPCKFVRNTLLKEVSFKDCIFEDRVDFDDMRFSGEEGQAPLHDCWRGMFHNVNFMGRVSWNWSPLYAISAFHRAVLREGLIYPEEIRPHEEVSAFKNQALRLARTAGEREEKKQYIQADALTALEGGARVLKQEMGKQENRFRQQRFFRFELMARRNNPTTPTVERCLLELFGRTSSYGQSFLQPVLWLLGLWVGSGAGFLGLALWRSELALTWDACIEGLSLSAYNLFRPFAIWRSVLGDDPEGNAVARALLTGPEGLALAVRVLATVQTFLGIALLFLVGLAIRRKFLIS